MINILSVISGSPVDKAGIRPGESVISINGEPVRVVFNFPVLFQLTKKK